MRKSGFICVALFSVALACHTLAYPADKPTCAVLTFDARSGISQDEALQLTDRFSAELDRLDQYTRISKEKQKEMLDEQEFARSENCSATACALEVGRQLAAQYIIYGSIGKVGQTYTVYAVLADVEERKVERSATCDQRGEIDGLLTFGMATSARRLLGMEDAAPVAAPRPEPAASVASALPAGERQRADRDLVVDLGNGVKLEFVWVSALKGWVGKYEVTNEEYRRYKSDHNSGEYKGHSLNGGRQPVVMVNFDDAKAYAEWINRTYSGQLPAGYKVRLPSEDEWMVFAQCGDGREYPWGNEWPPPNDWNYHGQEGAGSWSKIDGHNDGFPVTCPVENSGRNDWGLYGVGGNVWEVCASDSSGASFGAWRGASWGHGHRDYLRCSFRNYFVGSHRINYNGFRLVLSR